MTTMTKRHTAKSCASLAKRVYKGDGQIQAGENKRFVLSSERQAAQNEWHEAHTEGKRLRAELEAIPDPMPDMIAAAQFVVDVDGDEPSIPQLAKALAAAQHRQFVQEQLVDANKRSKAASNTANACHRCEVVAVHGRPFPHYTQIAAGDTWAEVAKKLEAKAEGR